MHPALYGSLLLIVGLALLLIAGDLLVRNAVAVASKFRIPTLVIGLTLVAFGTSAPEAFVAAVAAAQQHPLLASASALGSNVANVFLVLGAPAVFLAVPCNQRFLSRSAAFGVAVSIIPIVVSLSLGAVHKPLAVVFILLIVAYTLVAVFSTRNPLPTNPPIPSTAPKTPPKSLKIPALLIIAALAAMPFAAALAVDGAVAVAQSLAVPEAVIAATIVAAGTSLPEIAAAVAAAVRKQPAILTGSIIGSNIFNTLFVVAVAALASAEPLPLPWKSLQTILFFSFAASLAIAPFAVLKKPITPRAGGAFLLAYALFIFLVATTPNPVAP